MIRYMSRAGAEIRELNTVRKRLSAVKGGGLSAAAEPAHTVALILSNIVGDPIHLIASGPTVPNQDNPREAGRIIKKYNIDIPSSV